MLFCALCCSHSLLQSGGSLASIISTVSLSLSLSLFPFPPSLSHTHTHLLSASYTVLVCLYPPTAPIPTSLLARHHQNIDILSVLRQLAVEINHSCKSQPRLAVVVHALCMNVYQRRNNIKQSIVGNMWLETTQTEAGASKDVLHISVQQRVCHSNTNIGCLAYIHNLHILSAVLACDVWPAALKLN